MCYLLELKRLRKIRRLAICFLAWAGLGLCGMTQGTAQVLIDESFDGTGVDTSLFTFSSSGDESFFGRTQLNSPELPGAFDSPPVADGSLRLRLQTFNPFSPGNLFLADEIRTIQTFEPTADFGFQFDVRARFVDDATNPLAPGLVGGIFTFGLDENFPNPFERDEIDIELLSNFPNDSILLNVFNDEGFNSAGNVTFETLAALDITEFNDYRIELDADAIRFFVNDTLLREDVTDLAIEPQDFRLNINAPNSGFAVAFSNLLQPTANASQNETFIFEVDSLVIRQTAVPEPSSAVIGVAAVAAMLLRRRR